MPGTVKVSITIDVSIRSNLNLNQTFMFKTNLFFNQF